MGTYTNIRIGDRTIQIDAGRDADETYQLGDTVDWMVNPNLVHDYKLLDHVYDGTDDNGEAWFVCIKDHVVVEIVQQERPDLDAPQHEIELAPQRTQRAVLQEKHGIPAEFPRELWTDAAWEMYEEGQALAREASARGEDYFRMQFRSPGFFRQVMPPDNEPQHLRVPDGRELRVGQPYMHFDRRVTLDRIYSDDVRMLVKVHYEKGSSRHVPTEDLSEIP